jgi:hypothetical protein
MRRLLAALVVGCAALAVAPLAGATDFGVTEDETKSHPNVFYPQLAELGMSKNVISIAWDPDNPTALPAESAQIDALLPVARAHGIEVVFAVYQKRSAGLPGGGSVAVAQFSTWLQNVARRFPSVREYIGPNEPNQPRFWQGQFGEDCRNASGQSYFQAMSAMYDSLKSVDGGIKVIGVALSPRGNDNCRAESNVSTSPVRFIRHLGDAYRESGRTSPIMDAFSFHPYPNVNTDSPARGYAWPNIGLANLDRLKQAIWDAFDGTGQPTVEDGLKLTLDEVGWQTASERAGYVGSENVPAIDEGRQAEFYADVVKRAACDSSIASVDFFHLIDEADRARFQSGLLFADGARKASFGSVGEAIAATAGRCLGEAVSWRHATSVVGARANFGKLGKSSRKRSYWSFRATAGEDADYRAGVFRLSGDVDSGAISRSLAASGPSAVQVIGTKGLVKAGYNALIRTPNRRLAPGKYVYAIRMAASMNAKRTSFFVSAPFVVR